MQDQGRVAEARLSTPLPVEELAVFRNPQPPRAKANEELADSLTKG